MRRRWTVLAIALFLGVCFALAPQGRAQAKVEYDIYDFAHMLKDYQVDTLLKILKSETQTETLIGALEKEQEKRAEEKKGKGEEISRQPAANKPTQTPKPTPTLKPTPKPTRTPKPTPKAYQKVNYKKVARSVSAYEGVPLQFTGYVGGFGIYEGTEDAWLYMTVGGKNNSQWLSVQIPGFLSWNWIERLLDGDKVEVKGYIIGEDEISFVDGTSEMYPLFECETMAYWE